MGAVIPTTSVPQEGVPLPLRVTMACVSVVVPESWCTSLSDTMTPSCRLPFAPPERIVSR